MVSILCNLFNHLLRRPRMEEKRRSSRRKMTRRLVGRQTLAEPVVVVVVVEVIRVHPGTMDEEQAKESCI